MLILILLLYLKFFSPLETKYSKLEQRAGTVTEPEENITCTSQYCSTVQSTSGLLGPCIIYTTLKLSAAQCIVALFQEFYLLTEGVKVNKFLVYEVYNHRSSYVSVKCQRHNLVKLTCLKRTKNSGCICRLDNYFNPLVYNASYRRLRPTQLT